MILSVLGLKVEATQTQTDISQIDSYNDNWHVALNLILLSLLYM